MKSLSHQKSSLGPTYQPDTARHTLSEIFPERVTDAAAIGYMLSRVPRSGAPVLWVQDRLSYRETGRPYLAGTGPGHPVIMVSLSRAVDVLWALEDGLRCAALAAVIGEIWGDPPALDFTATKRLAVRAEAANIPCWLIRHAGTPNLSAARARWRIGSAPSAPHAYDAQAPGMPRWSLDLFRARHTQPGQWEVTYDGQTNRLDHAAPFPDGAVAPDGRASRQRAAV